MNIFVAVIIALLIFFVFIGPFISSGLVAGLLLLAAVVVGIIIWKRNFELRKTVLKDYDSEKLMIQNVQRGGVIRLLNVDGQMGDLDLKVIGRNLYMEGNYSWYELECVNADGEKFWIDVEDDDELVVSIVLKKLQKADIKFSPNSLDMIDENESGTASYEGQKFLYIDSGEAVFYKRSDDKVKEKLYYWDFKSGKYLISAERWDNPDGKSGMEYFYSQVLKPASVIVYSNKGESEE